MDEAGAAEGSGLNDADVPAGISSGGRNRRARSCPDNDQIEGTYLVAHGYDGCRSPAWIGTGSQFWEGVSGHE